MLDTMYHLYGYTGGPFIGSKAASLQHGLKSVNLTCFGRPRTLMSDDVITTVRQMFYLPCFD